MGTNEILSPGENVRVIVLLINEILSRALSDGFKSVFIASTNQLMRVSLAQLFVIKNLRVEKLFFWSNQNFSFSTLSQKSSKPPTKIEKFTFGFKCCRIFCWKSLSLNFWMIMW